MSRKRPKSGEMPASPARASPPWSRQDPGNSPTQNLVELQFEFLSLSALVLCSVGYRDLVVLLFTLLNLSLLTGKIVEQIRSQRDASS